MTDQPDPVVAPVVDTLHGAPVSDSCGQRVLHPSREQYVSVVSGWGGAVPLWGGEVAKKVNFLEQGGSVWTFKLMK